MNQQNKSYKVLGIMSGTSFDGIDFCLAKFQKNKSGWAYKIIATKTYSYTKDWKKRILGVENGSSDQLIKLHFEYGSFLGELSSSFLKQHQLHANFIASHGHTIFHQIENGFTFQLGHGASIAAAAHLPCISDFRSLDVALMGQGAPLVPIGDHLLFSEYDCCINLGGIANLSFNKKGKRYAFDIAPANMILNYLYQQSYDGEYDKDGIISNSGKINTALFNRLNGVPFYAQDAPKSLGKEYVFSRFVPLLQEEAISIEDKLSTFSHHLIHQISTFLEKEKLTKNVLLTGGGAKNNFLLKLFNQSEIEIAKTNMQLIDYKEALIFAFLGVLRVLGEENTLQKVTGASKNSCGGSIFLP